jgi:hypothetical protein
MVSRPSPAATRSTSTARSRSSCVARRSAVAAALPQGRLAVLPGTHLLPTENPDVVNALLLWFLAGATPAVQWSAIGPGR